jgi:pimeloyl-[acyl-carrier protein] methyl ester esterase
MFNPASPMRLLLGAWAFGVLLAGGSYAPPAAAAGELRQQTAPFRSDRLTVEVLGQGPDVVLIPGFASSREVWRREAERLQGSRRVHLVQFAGFAGEPWIHGDGPFLEPAVGELERYLVEAKLSEPALIGHSMGGAAALMLAQRRPDLAGRVMSVDSLPFYSALFGPQVTSETARPFAAQASAMILSADEDGFRQNQTQTATAMARNPMARQAMVEWSVASDRRAMAAAMGELITLDLRPGLPAMTLPVWAVYAADADGGAPAALADALWAREYSGLSDVRLVRVDDTRHFIMADQPARFAQLVDQFLAD